MFLGLGHLLCTLRVEGDCPCLHNDHEELILGVVSTLKKTIALVIVSCIDFVLGLIEEKAEQLWTVVVMLHTLHTLPYEYGFVYDDETCPSPSSSY